MSVYVLGDMLPTIKQNIGSITLSLITAGMLTVQPYAVSSPQVYAFGKTTPLELKHNIDVVGRINPDTYAMIDRAFTVTYQNYPKVKELGLTIVMHPMSEHIGAAFTDSNITQQELEQELKKPKINYSVLNTSYINKEKGTYTFILIDPVASRKGTYSLSESVEDTLHHELAHVMTRTRGTNTKELQDYFFKNHYAMLNLKDHHEAHVSEYGAVGGFRQLGTRGYEVVKGAESATYDSPLVNNNKEFKKLIFKAGTVTFTQAKAHNIKFYSKYLNHAENAIKEYLGREDIAETYVAMQKGMSTDRPIIQKKMKFLEEYLKDKWGDE